MAVAQSAESTMQCIRVCGVALEMHWKSMEFNMQGHTLTVLQSILGNVLVKVESLGLLEFFVSALAAAEQYAASASAYVFSHFWDKFLFQAVRDKGVHPIDMSF